MILTCNSIKGSVCPKIIYKNSPDIEIICLVKSCEDFENSKLKESKEC
jgi:hypothetical protein